MEKQQKIVLVYPAIPWLNDTSLILPLSLIYIATPLRNRFEITIIDGRVLPDWRAVLAPRAACCSPATTNWQPAGACARS